MNLNDYIVLFKDKTWVAVYKTEMIFKPEFKIILFLGDGWSEGLNISEVTTVLKYDGSNLINVPIR